MNKNYSATCKLTKYPSKSYFCIHSLEDNNDISIYFYGYEAPGTKNPGHVYAEGIKYVQYSTDKKTWTYVDPRPNQITYANIGTIVTLNKDEQVYFRMAQVDGGGLSNIFNRWLFRAISSQVYPDEEVNYSSWYFGSSKTCNISGDLNKSFDSSEYLSIGRSFGWDTTGWSGEDWTRLHQVNIRNDINWSLFKGLQLVNAEYLFGKVSNCGKAFYNQTKLVTAPKLTLDTSSLIVGQYDNMFTGCTSLETAIKISNVVNIYGQSIPSGKNYPVYAFRNMYYGCSKIKVSEGSSATYNKTYFKFNRSSSKFDDIFTNMFSGTGGEFTGSPRNNRFNNTYYIANTIV